MYLYLLISEYCELEKETLGEKFVLNLIFREQLLLTTAIYNALRTTRMSPTHIHHIHAPYQIISFHSPNKKYASKTSHPRR